MELILSVGKIKQQSTDPNTRTRSDQTALIKADPLTSAQHRFVAVGSVIVDTSTRHTHHLLAATPPHLSITYLV